MKFIRVLIPLVLVGIIITISYNTYNKAKVSSNNPISVIPNHSSVILKFNDPNKIYKLFNEKIIWNKLSTIFNAENLNFHLKKINDLYNNFNFNNEKSIYITLLKDGVSSSDFLISSELDDASFNKITGKFSNNLLSSEYDNTTIFQITSDSLNIYFSSVNKIACFSSSKTIIEDAIKSAKSEYNFVNDSRFTNIYNTLNQSSDINIIYNLNNLINIQPEIKNSNLFLLKSLNNWVAADLKIKNNKIIMNGYNLIDYKLSNFSDILNSQKSTSLKSNKFIPNNINYLFSIGFDNANKLFSNSNKYLENKNQIWETEKNRKRITSEYNFDYKEFVDHLDNEAGFFSCGNIKNEEIFFSFIKTKESIHASSLLQRLIDTKKSSIYLKKEINFIHDDKIIQNIFGEKFNFNNQNYFIEINDFFIFSNSKDNLEFIIDNYISGNTLENNSNFNNFKNNTLNKSNVFVYFNTRRLFSNIESNLNLNFNLDSLENFTGLAYQISNNKSYQINNLSLFFDEDYKENIKEKWFYQLDTISNMTPQIVYNHSLKENAVVIQDLSNKIYYITNNKKFSWTRKLENQIIGNISQGDFFKNNKIQMLFNTKEKIYQLDRYGRDVEKFPLKIKEKTSFGHSLFDYNNSKRYRIMIIGNDNSIANLNSKGKNVLGWKYSNKESINQELFHFKKSDKDYIVKSSDNKIELLAVNGTSRIEFKSDRTLFSKNNIILDNNYDLITATSNGLFICNLDGSSNKIAINNLDSTSILAFGNLNNQLIFSNKNKLFVLDENYNQIISKSFKDNIIDIEILNEYIAVKTNSKIILLKENEIVKGTPLNYDGNCSVRSISDESKIDILLTRKKILYNYQLE
ncbi:MAG: hypothetical protein ACJ0QC_03200 [Flavobacteriales bacterium]